MAQPFGQAACGIKLMGAPVRYSRDPGKVTCPECHLTIPACDTCGRPKASGCRCAVVNEVLARLPKRSG